jgi:diguanylate cyclase (GGDEF)-like protein
MERAIERFERENARLQARCARIREEQLRAWQSATRDALTRLPNRALFEDRLTQALHLAARARRRVAVAFMDLDGFKQVNDCHGHCAGDELLTRVAQRLRQATREGDTVARLGGDEFALLLENLDAQACVGFLRERVHRIVCAPLVIDATLGGAPAVVRPRASIGIALFPDHAQGGDALLRRADASMYAVKRDGGGVRLCAS